MKIVQCFVNVLIYTVSYDWTDSKQQRRAVLFFLTLRYQRNRGTQPDAGVFVYGNRDNLGLPQSTTNSELIQCCWT